MAKVVLAPALSRWLPGSSDKPTSEVALEVAGTRVGEVLDGVFALHPNLRGYVADEHGAVRHHVAMFVDGDAIRDKRTRSDRRRAGCGSPRTRAITGRNCRRAFRRCMQ